MIHKRKEIDNMPGPGSHGRGMPPSKPQNTKATIKRILSYLTEKKLLLFIVAIGILLGQSFFSWDCHHVMY